MANYSLRLTAAAAMVVAVVATTTSCSSHAAHPHRQPRSASPSKVALGGYAPGERPPTSVTGVCQAVPAQSLHRLQLPSRSLKSAEHAHSGDDLAPDCDWRDRASDAPEPSRELSVDVEVSVPQSGRSAGSATDQARYSYEHHVWFSDNDIAFGDDKDLAAVTVAGLGAQAKLVRVWDNGSTRLHGASLLVRDHNMVINISLAVQTYDPGAFAAVPGMAHIEAELTRVAGPVLRRAGIAPKLRPAGRYRAGEARRISGHCATADTSALLPGGSVRRVAAPTATDEQHCEWDRGEDFADVAIAQNAPAPLTGESASQVAHQLYRAAGRNGQPLHLRGADESFIDASVPDEDGSSAVIIARRRNVLIEVDYFTSDRVALSSFRPALTRLAERVLAQQATVS